MTVSLKISDKIRKDCNKKENKRRQRKNLAVAVCDLQCSLLAFVKPSNSHRNNPVRSKLLLVASLLCLCPGGMWDNRMTLGYRVYSDI